MKAKKVTKTSLDMHGCEQVVDQLLSALDDMDFAKARANAAREVLDNEAVTLRENQERLGVFVGTMNARGTNRSGTYVFKNSFSSTTPASAVEVKEQIGPAMYDELFVQTTTAKLRDAKRVKELRTLLGDRFDEFFTVDVAVKPVKDFNERKFGFAQGVSEHGRAALNNVARVFSHKPQFKAK